MIANESGNYTEIHLKKKINKICILSFLYELYFRVTWSRKVLVEEVQINKEKMIVKNLIF